MLTGAHAIIYSTKSERDRAFFRDVLKLPAVDVGHGWLIFGLPPAEVAVHPSEKNDVHEFYLMCDNIEAFIAEMESHDVACTPPHDQGYGVFTHLTLPGGGKLGVYQPRHARPPALEVAAPRKKAATAKKQKTKKQKAKKRAVKRPARKPVKKKSTRSPRRS